MYLEFWAGRPSFSWGAYLIDRVVVVDSTKRCGTARATARVGGVGVEGVSSSLAAGRTDWDGAFIVEGALSLKWVAKRWVEAVC